MSLNQRGGTWSWLHQPPETGPVIVEKVHTGKVVGISIIAALGGFLFGYDSSVINGANKAVFYQFQIENTSLQGFVVAIALLGSAVGAFFGGRLARQDRPQEGHGHRRDPVPYRWHWTGIPVQRRGLHAVARRRWFRDWSRRRYFSDVHLRGCPGPPSWPSPHCSNWQSWSASSPLSWSTRSSSPWFPTQFRSR